MAHLLKRGANILRYGNTIFRVKDKQSNYSSVTYTYSGLTGSSLKSIALDKDHNRMFVCCGSGNSVLTIDLTTMAVTNTITGFSSPNYVRMDVANNRCLVNNGLGTQIHAIDLTTLARTNFFTTPAAIRSFEYDYPNNRLYVAQQNNMMVNLNATTGAVISSSIVYSTLSDVLIDGSYIYSSSGAQFLVLNKSDMSQVFLGTSSFNGPFQFALDNLNNRIMIPQFGNATLGFADRITFGVLTALSGHFAATGSSGVAYDEPTGKIYVSNVSTHQIAVLTPIYT